MENFKLGWYLIYTNAMKEKKVAERLHEKRITNFLPLVQKIHTWHDRKKIIQTPLFPSYVFVKPNSLKEFYTILDTVGASHYIRFENKPIIIGQKVIDTIDLLLKKGENLELQEKKISPGQKYLIQHGPLAGLICEIIQCGDKKKILVRVDFMNSNLLIDLSAEYILTENCISLNHLETQKINCEAK